jgi:hypothetical protein
VEEVVVGWQCWNQLWLQAGVGAREGATRGDDDALGGANGLLGAGAGGVVGGGESVLSDDDSVLGGGVFTGEA